MMTVRTDDPEEKEIVLIGSYAANMVFTALVTKIWWFDFPHI